ncbi:MAG: FAD-dependent monooxygenase [Ardenticatenaceae bacterium]|nr:FAD-dependent monooxygenase [Ardenticatenaceae bacterium]
MKTQVAIVGGGPGGAATAMFLQQAGVQSVVVEKDPFPRFHIGESMTGECGKIVRDLGFEEEMLQRRHPVKQGVNVYGPGGKNTFWVPVMRREDDGELIATTTWQVRRSEFDQMLLDGAKERGIPVLQGQALEPIYDEDRTVRGVRVKLNDGEIKEIECDVLVDASGPSTFLNKAGLTSKKERGNYDNQVAVFSHVKGALRDEVDNTLIFYRQKNHWGWFIPLDDDVVSIGIVAPSEYFAEKQESKQDYFLREIQELNPQLTKRVKDVTLAEDVRAVSNYSYEIKDFTGKGYLCIGDSHRFVDPIFSFGLHFAVSEARLASCAIATYLSGESEDQENPFAAFQETSTYGQDAIQSLVDCFWQHPFAFAVFAHSRYKEDVIDLFAGRIYADKPSRGLIAMRNMVNSSR